MAKGSSLSRKEMITEKDLKLHKGMKKFRTGKNSDKHNKRFSRVS